MKACKRVAGRRSGWFSIHWGNHRRTAAVLSQWTLPPAFRRQLLDAMPRLRRYTRSLVFDAGQADDLTQSTLERALTHWHQFGQQRNMLVWPLSIAHNAHLDTFRRDGRTTATDPAELQREMDRLGGDAGPDIGLQIDLLSALRRLRG